MAAQKNQWELDKLVTWTEPTKKMNIDEVEGMAREGAYVYGLFLQGSRWDTVGGVLERSKPKEMFCKMPIINVQARAADRVAVDMMSGFYSCPCYKTEQRGPTFTFCANLRTKSSQGRWVLAGTALIMDAV